MSRSARDGKHPNWGSASRGQGAIIQAQRLGKPKTGRNSLLHYFSAGAQPFHNMDKEKSLNTDSPDDEEKSFETDSQGNRADKEKSIEPENQGNEENMENEENVMENEANLHEAWRNNNALLQDPDDKSHQDEE
jgi:hypothetical protein